MLTVGRGKRFSRIGDALAAAADGDTVLIDEGEYPGDIGTVERKAMTIRALGHGAVIHADGRHVEGKATWVVRGEALIENVEFRGARVPSGNGAGIRFERGHLLLRRCRFFDNENGLLSAGESWMTLEVDDSEFGDAPRHMGSLHHQLYVGTIGRFALRRSRFSKGWRGHLVKSRAGQNTVVDNVMADGEVGEASYELEFPNGGANVVIGNVISQSPLTQNPTLLSMGAEGRPGNTGSLLLAHNTFIDGGVPDARFLRVYDDRLGGAVPLRAYNNIFAGNARLDMPAGADGGGNVRVPLAALEPDGRLRKAPAEMPVPMPPEAGPPRPSIGAR